MVKNHLKSIAAPNSWPIKRKAQTFVAKPNPGAHSLKDGMTVRRLFINLLKLAKIAKEVKTIINSKEVLVDNKKVKDIDMPVGLFDVVSIPETKTAYRLSLDIKGKFIAVEIDAKEADIKPQKVTGKTIIGKDKVQLNFHDGRNVLQAAKTDVKVGDTVVMDIAKNTYKDVFKFEKGAAVFLTGGSHVGKVAVLDAIDNLEILVKIEKDVLKTKKRFAYVLGESKSLIKVGN